MPRLALLLDDHATGRPLAGSNRPAPATRRSELPASRRHPRRSGPLNGSRGLAMRPRTGNSTRGLTTVRVQPPLWKRSRNTVTRSPASVSNKPVTMSCPLRRSPVTERRNLKALRRARAPRQKHVCRHSHLRCGVKQEPCLARIAAGHRSGPRGRSRVSRLGHPNGFRGMFL